MEPVRIRWRYDGPIEPALRDGTVVAWDVIGRGDRGTGPERSFLLLDHGVKITIPWVWKERGDPIWYVDLTIVRQDGDLYHLIDLDIDLFVPTDGRPYRTLDLDEFADAIEDGEFAIAEAMDGLRRWQRFLDTHLHRFGPGDVQPGWKDFPPAAIARLAALPDGAISG